MTGSAKTTAQRAVLDAALAYAALGFAPVPMVTGLKRPAMRGWRGTASCDEASVRAAFRAAPHADGLAIATGGGVLVIDLDRNHASDANGISSLGALARGHGDAIPYGPRVRTPNGGVHIYLSCAPDICIPNRVGLAPGVDVRGDGGLALAPPSRVANRDYRWHPNPMDAAIPAAPSWLIGLIRGPVARPPQLSVRPFSGISAYARAAFDREVDNVANATRGTRNHTLFVAAANLGSLAAAGALDIEEIEAGLTGAAIACGLVRDDGARSAALTIASGLRRGLARPRLLPDRTRHGS